jgi:opacity protein-like surface antigen
MMRGYRSPKTKLALQGSVALAVLCVAAMAPAHAEDAAAPVSPYKFSALVDAGIYGNTNAGSVNAGQLFTDKHDQLVLNQFLMTAQRDLDPKAEGFDWGFKVQAMYGTDARYTHFLGMFDHNTTDRNQVDITEANLLGHLPVLTEGGVDVKLGAYSTPMGYEVIQANSNPLYSHSYIFNYGLPLKHTGVLTNTHLNPTWDIYLGVDSGVNTTYGQRGDNNGRMAGMVGFGLNNLMDGKLTVLALSHFGPEGAEARLDQTGGNAQASHYGKYINDITATYKPNDEWTWVTEVNYVRDDNPAINAKAFGLAQYGIYQWNSWLSLIGRAELFADPQGQFVASYARNRDPVNAERGAPLDDTQTLNTTNAVARQGTTYGALTFGANIKLPDAPAYLDGTMIRPEVRWDRSMNGVNAFNYGADRIARDAGQVSAGIDLVMPITF